EFAKKVAEAAEQKAAENSWPVAIAIVDEGGHLVYLARRDGTQYGSIDVAIRKAGTAAAFKRPTKVFEDAVAGGRTALLGLPGAPGPPRLGIGRGAGLARPGATAPAAGERPPEDSVESRAPRRRWW